MADESFGIVYSGEKELLCSTCKYGKTACAHVKMIYNSITMPEYPKILQPFAFCLKANTAACPKEFVCPSLQSNKSIPFNLSSDHCTKIALPFTERFKMSEGICHLSEENSLPCSECGISCWHSTTDLTRIITSNKVLPALSK